MPFINLKLLKTGITKEQKAQVVKEFTETLQNVLGKDPKYTHIVIDEIEKENWGYAGELSSKS